MMKAVENAAKYTLESWEYIRYMVEEIGGRGSCRPEERQASEYVAEALRKLGVQDVRLEAFRGVYSTYIPFALAFGTALLGTLGALLIDNRWMLAIAAILNALGVLGMWLEIDMSPNWLRWFTPKGASQNVAGVIPARQEARRKVVICSHLDTHRAPIFYSSPTWHRVFNLLVTLTFLSMALGALVFSLGALFSFGGLRWIGVLLAPFQVFALGMCIHADFSPFSPGANDNTSAVGVALGLAHRLQSEPLENIDAYFVFTGCEEVGAYGMTAYLEAHAQELGDDTLYLVLEQLGFGKMLYILSEGVMVKHPVHPQALQLANTVAERLPELGIRGVVGMAYSDAMPAIKRGLLTVTITNDPPAIGEVSQWHQMTDDMAHLRPEYLTEGHAFAWEVLLHLERNSFDKSG